MHPSFVTTAPSPGQGGDYRRYAITIIRLCNIQHLFTAVKMIIFSCFLFFLKTQNVGTRSNEDPQSMFYSKKKKKENDGHPCKPQFHNIKFGHRGDQSHGHVILVRLFTFALFFRKDPGSKSRGRAVDCRASVSLFLLLCCPSSAGGNMDGHYDNTPMQYSAIFHCCENANFLIKNSDNFLFFCSKHRLWVQVYRTASVRRLPPQ